VTLTQELSCRWKKVSHRLCTGANLGLLELVDLKPHRGAIEHYNSRGRAYISERAWARGPKLVKEPPAVWTPGLVLEHTSFSPPDTSEFPPPGPRQAIKTGVSTPVRLSEARRRVKARRSQIRPKE
jgi:hypothetical protein